MGAGAGSGFEYGLVVGSSSCALAGEQQSASSEVISNFSPLILFVFCCVWISEWLAALLWQQLVALFVVLGEIWGIPSARRRFLLDDI